MKMRPGLGPWHLALSSLALLRNCGLTALPAASAADCTAVGVGGTWGYVGAAI